MPRRLLRDGQIVEDEWRYPAEAADAPAAPLLIPFDQWQPQRAAWLARGSLLGVVLQPADEPERLLPDLRHFALIAAQFPGPGEGRGYSHARLLRERWNFRGEMRAVGYVRRDQVFFLARCGFNSFELDEDELEAARSALSTFSAAYQPANDAGLALNLAVKQG